MKDQYVGDVNDYLKYSILRGLASPDVPLVICWMLTKPDGRQDGRLTAYLREPDVYRDDDPIVFDALRRIVVAGERTVAAVEESRFLAPASFHSRTLTNDPRERTAYFQELWRTAPAGALLFFDPDNGFEVASVRKGHRNSDKYLYWDEVEESYRRGHSLLVYQHFPRVQRVVYLEALLETVGRCTGATGSFVLTTRRVAYVVIPRPRDRSWLHRRAEATARRLTPKLGLLGRRLHD